MVCFDKNRAVKADISMGKNTTIYEKTSSVRKIRILEVFVSAYLCEITSKLTLSGS